MAANIIDSAIDLREIYPMPKGVPVDKQLPSLDKHCRTFIAHAPFLVLGTEGDVSPKGDDPGFVKVVDDNTLVIPDRKGNNRLDSLQNIIDNPKVGLLFMIPGVNETLRVNGTAKITTDPKILEPFALNGRPPASAIVVQVEEAYLHCAKALIRSHLWKPETQVAKGTIPPAGQMYADHVGAKASLNRDYEAHIAEDLAEEGRG